MPELANAIESLQLTENTIKLLEIELLKNQIEAEKLKQRIINLKNYSK